ncbi:hypothetical protein [Streptomyces sp. KMM 9044]|uniref:hypothetical protein n=1 Tax=Streptomyces sp. KMM 9044 TaxID=2744474 RepID=UPI00215184A7|nr:hypothetical protein [Streptomyces sp. KMM 9044]WAX76421.1 hypothetical protein HUV60_000665 [Streptomyces sp. KMM 9044]
MHDTAVAALRQHDDGDPLGRIQQPGPRGEGLGLHGVDTAEARLRPVVVTSALTW